MYFRYSKLFQLINVFACIAGREEINVEKMSQRFITSRKHRQSLFGKILLVELSSFVLLGFQAALLLWWFGKGLFLSPLTPFPKVISLICCCTMLPLLFLYFFLFQSSTCAFELLNSAGKKTTFHSLCLLPQNLKNAEVFLVIQSLIGVFSFFSLMCLCKLFYSCFSENSRLNFLRKKVKS